MTRLLAIRLHAWLACLGVALLTSACATFRAPVDPFPAQPTTTGELVQQLQARTVVTDRLQATLEVTASGGPVRGSQRLNVLTLYIGPDKILLKGDHSAAGDIFQIRQSGADASVYLPKEGRWYRGTVAELDAHPEALYGLHPVDVIHTLLAGQIVLDLLQAKDAATPLSLADNHSHWLIGTDPGPDRLEAYYLRQSDGLVGGIVVMGTNGKRRLTVDYQRYANFNGILLPSEFRLRFDSTKMTLKVKVLRISVTQAFNEGIISTKTPPIPEIRPQPFADWFAGTDTIPVK